MSRANINYLLPFFTVARERSFTRAAAKLGVSQSALSHTVRQLEESLGVRLLTRTTRSVSLTEAGERLVNSVGGRFEEIEAELDAMSDLRDRPAGTIRLSAGEHVTRSILWPRLAEFLPRYPDIKVEILIENSLIDIVAERFDAGVRLGEQVAKDMIAVRIGPDVRFAAVASKAYFATHPVPRSPQELVAQSCINLRQTTRGGLYAWEFEKDGRELRVQVEGQLTFNSVEQILSSALAGFGIAFIPEDMTQQYLADGRLVRVLEDWCPRWTGYHLYYPSRRQPSPAFSLLLNALRYRV